MSTFVIAGGNSGIGLQTARNLLTAEHRVILLGRDKRKAQAALDSFGPARDRAEFHAVDLATHDGVRDAAAQVTASSDRIDGILHSAGEFIGGEARTADGIPLLVAVGYLSRYHLTQLLLPNLLKADHPRVVMMTAHLNHLPPLQPELFPYFEPYDIRTILYQTNAASMYYANHLSITYPTLFGGVVCPGLVRTGIFHKAPWHIRALTAISAPFRANSLDTAATNPTQALLHGEGSTGTYWDTAQDFNDTTPITVDPDLRQALIDTSRETTGA
jgi:NAD(P)-dependent dehydrogenase (short-subunit alcohol dehydrogenase family)